MAKVRAIFQPVPGAVTHQKNVTDLFPKSGITAVWLSSAFVNGAGVSALQAVLSSCATVTKCVVGIRNGASTIQGLTALLATGAEIYVVDTGTPYRIFHPKFYAVISKTEAFVIIGSANTTYGGLYSNIEASAYLCLDMSDQRDAEFLAGLTDPIEYLIKTYPLNCYRLTDVAQANQLLADGIVEDENNPKVSGPVGIATKGAKSGGVPLMALPKGIPRKAKPPLGSAPAAATMAPALAGMTQPVTYGHLVWAKPSLPRSDLQFPGANGNATGVLRLTQAKFTVGGSVIDQTTYFRNNVFGNLTWMTTTSGKETSVVNLALVIAGVLVGIYDLPLSHKSA
jgi:PLD-like domain